MYKKTVFGKTFLISTRICRIFILILLLFLWTITMII